MELGAMSYLSQTPHGNVLRMFSVYEDDVYVFLELECLSGGDLFEAVQGSPGGKFDEPRARKVLLELLQGLCFMHGRGIVHRDLSLGELCSDTWLCRALHEIMPRFSPQMNPSV
jgi:serine/threonine protein kinase